MYMAILVGINHPLAVWEQKIMEKGWKSDEILLLKAELILFRFTISS